MNEISLESKDPVDLAHKAIKLMETWSRAVTDPKQFMSGAHPFQPDDNHIAEALAFYITMLSVSMLIMTPFILGQKSEFAEKAKLVASSVMGLLFSAVVAMTWHFSFKMMGGTASFGGSYLAFVYSAGPFGIPMTIVSLLIFAALPPDYRPRALNPTTANAVMAQAKTDARTNQGLLGVGGLLALVLMIWSLVIQFRCLTFVHGVTGFWKLTGTVFLSLALAVPIGLLWKHLGGLLSPELPAAPAAALPPPEGGAA